MHEFNRTLSNQAHRHKINLETILTTNKIILNTEVLSISKSLVTLTYRQKNDLQLEIMFLDTSDRDKHFQLWKFR